MKITVKITLVLAFMYSFHSFAQEYVESNIVLKSYSPWDFINDSLPRDWQAGDDSYVIGVKMAKHNLKRFINLVKESKPVQKLKKSNIIKSVNVYKKVTKPKFNFKLSKNSKGVFRSKADFTRRLLRFSYEEDFFNTSMTYYFKSKELVFNVNQKLQESIILCLAKENNYYTNEKKLSFSIKAVF